MTTLLYYFSPIEGHCNESDRVMGGYLSLVRIQLYCIILASLKDTAMKVIVVWEVT